MNLITRLAKLESTGRPAAAPRRVIRLVVNKDEGETTEAVIARWCTENPDQAPPAEEDLVIIRSLISPQRQTA